MMSLEQVFMEILWNCLSQVQANATVVLRGEDTEGVHQMRVGLRRFRSCLTLFNRHMPCEVTQAVRNDLRLLLNPLGPARDWDVFLAEHLRPMTESLPEVHPLQRVRAAAEQRRLEHYGKLHLLIRSRDYGRLILKVASWIACRQWQQGMAPEVLARFQAPAVAEADRLLSRGHNRVVRRGKGIGHMPEADLHRLRIAVKKQRYATEFFQPLFRGKAARRYRKALVGLQDVLGHLNDAVTAETLLKELGPSCDPQALAYVAGWHARGTIDLRARLAKAWRPFTARKRFWK
jgi:CHAD domain-containing protein